jgi:DNA end-binding protein Ku
MAPRSIWNGTIAFGLMTVPVKLHTATESKTIHFTEVHLDDGAKIEHRRFCSKEDREVEYKDVVKGYEVAEGKYVVLDKDEVKAAAGARGKVIEIEDFVPGDQIDPLFYEKTYYVGCRDDGEAYRVFRAALERTGRIGIGRFTFHDREYLAAVRPLDGVLALHTMRFADDLVDPGDLELPRVNRKPAGKEIDMAGKLVQGLHTDFDPSDYKDAYRREVMKVIRRKAAGKEIEPPEEPEDERPDDLAAALEASLSKA